LKEGAWSGSQAGQADTNMQLIKVYLKTKTWPVLVSRFGYTASSLVRQVDVINSPVSCEARKTPENKVKQGFATFGLSRRKLPLSAANCPNRLYVQPLLGE
jgi:hypothetical protein